ncbi:hypothetical protein CPAR01_06076 [Colletotrichum paranaense]|uniref:Secreted protein n=1 Tax=Colletotrichum paranaense TaxID=1914294 RepID=A0ABQ9ST43_9PEZI|nr:uncharacterized protein CPAR01_06076 [Colletotrichum paranaense]KAK1542689.1 hypothetical protein CPAR01_06076 [Colletotrichum paranaense]
MPLSVLCFPLLSALITLWVVLAIQICQESWRLPGCLLSIRRNSTALDGPGHLYYDSCTPRRISWALLEWFISFPASPSSICICISIRTCNPRPGFLGKGKW